MQTIFRRTRLSIATLVSLAGVVAAPANAQLKFDDVTTNAAGFNTSAFNSYNGYTFLDWGVLTSASTFGAGNNAVSPSKFAYAQADGSSYIYRADNTFNFASAFLSFRQFDANLAPASIIVRGYRPGDIDATFEQSVLLTNTAQLFSFQFTGVEELEFETIGLQANGRSAILAMDDLDVAVVPEPSSIVLLTSGLAGIVVAARRRKSRSV